MTVRTLTAATVGGSYGSGELATGPPNDWGPQNADVRVSRAYITRTTFVYDKLVDTSSGLMHSCLVTFCVCKFSGWFHLMVSCMVRHRGTTYAAVLGSSPGTPPHPTWPLAQRVVPPWRAPSALLCFPDMFVGRFGFAFAPFGAGRYCWLTDIVRNRCTAGLLGSSTARTPKRAPPIHLHALPFQHTPLHRADTHFTRQRLRILTFVWTFTTVQFFLHYANIPAHGAGTRSKQTPSPPPPPIVRVPYQHSRFTGQGVTFCMALTYHLRGTHRTICWTPAGQILPPSLACFTGHHSTVTCYFGRAMTMQDTDPTD